MKKQTKLALLIFEFVILVFGGIICCIEEREYSNYFRKWYVSNPYAGLGVVIIIICIFAMIFTAFSLKKGFIDKTENWFRTQQSELRKKK